MQVTVSHGDLLSRLRIVTMIAGMKKRTPFRNEARDYGRKGKASLDGSPCPSCKRGTLRCIVGPLPIFERGTFPHVLYNACDKCGAELVTEAEYNRPRK